MNENDQSLIYKYKIRSGIDNVDLGFATEGEVLL
jgi:hypothetical protein